MRWTVWKSKFQGAFVPNRRVDLHAINATPARWRGDAGSSPLDRARTAAPSPRNDLVKNCRVHPTHWLISTQVLADDQIVVVDVSSCPGVMSCFITIIEQSVVCDHRPLSHIVESVGRPLFEGIEREIIPENPRARALVVQRALPELGRVVLEFHVGRAAAFRLFG